MQHLVIIQGGNDKETENIPDLAFLESIQTLDTSSLQPYTGIGRAYIYT